MKQIYTLSLFLIFSFLSFGQFNAVETFTSANGLSNDGCSDVLVENDGTVWVGHDFYSQPSLNGMPISRRQPNGTWDYPFSSVGLPVITVNGSPYQWTSFAVKEIYQRANGEIWFIAKTGNSSDMNNSPPILIYHNGNFSARHISLNNFPNKGAVHTMVEDIYGYLWFGCEEGLVKLNANTGLFSTYNPPSETIVSGRTHNSKRIFSIDYDANGRILMLTGFPTSIAGSQSLLRIFDQHNLTWDYWTHRDAPWWSATQTDYAPSDIVALRDIQNTIHLSTNGGGYYTITNSNWSSHQLQQVADFVRGWDHPGYSFPNVYTNLANFTTDVYLDPEENLWLIGISGSNYYAYTQKFEIPTTYLDDGVIEPATEYLFGYLESQIQYNNNGTLQPSPYKDLDFYANEIWIASQHGLERWYYDTLNPSGEFIGLEGAGAQKLGVAGFNTKTGNVNEPQKTGHNMPNPSFPSISIDTAYYYLSTLDYDNIDPNLSAGIKGDGHYNGFTATARALTAAGLTFEDLELRFSPIGMGKDRKDEEWSYANLLEIRNYEEWFSVSNGGTVNPESHYEILIDGKLIFRDRMPDFQLHTRYNKYGYLFDSIGGFSDYTPLTPYPNITDPTAADIKDSLLADLNGKAVRFIFRTIQTARNEEITTADRRGGKYRITDAYLQKGDTVVMKPGTPLCGTYTIGQTVNADYRTFRAAAADLAARGIICDVTFIVGKGLYNERVEIGQVEGMDLYRITFDGSDAGPDISYNPPGADSNFVFQINGTANLTLKGLNIENTNATHGINIDLNGSTPNFQLLECELTGTPSGSFSDDDLTLISCNDCDSLLIDQGLFTNGSDGLNLRGTVMTVQNSTFKGQFGNALDFGNGSSTSALNNLIEGPNSGNFRGILGSGYPYFFKNNQVLNQTAECLGAIDQSYFGLLNPNGDAEVWNNEIAVQMTGMNTNSALSLGYGHTKVYHNTISVSGNSSNSVALGNFQHSTGYELRNNILVNQNGYCIMVTREMGGNWPNSDYNLYYSGSATPFLTYDNMNPGFDQTLAAFQTTTSAEANSSFLDPQFSAASHLLPMNAAASELGTGLAALRVDRLDRPRDHNSPDQGCYEFDGVGWTGANGTGWNDPLNWSDLKVPTNQSKVFVSPRNNHPILANSAQVKEFIMHHQAQLRIEPNAGLQVDSLLKNSGEIILEAQVNGGYARLIQGAIAGGGKITQEAVLQAPTNDLRWFHLGVPVRTKVRDLANINTHITAGNNGASIYFWDAATGNWISPPDTSAYLNPGTGYAVAAGNNAYGDFLTSSFPAIIDVQGDLRAGDSIFSVNLSYTQSPSFNSYVSQVTDGWNFLANPYHAVYDMQGQSLPGTYKTVYVWDGTTYKQYNTALDLGDSEARYIAPLQGFFIRVDNASQANQGFDFDPAQRDLSSVQTIAKTNRPSFQLQVSGGKYGQSDRSYFLIEPSAQAGFEINLDAAKLSNAADHFSFYSLAQSDPVAINVLPESALLQGVPLGFESPDDTSYVLRLDSGAAPGYGYYLKDHLLDLTWRLDMADYDFQHQSENIAERFTLFLQPESVGGDEDPSLDLYLHCQDGSLYLHQLPLEALQLSIHDLSGKLLHRSTKKAGHSEWEIPLSHLNLQAVILHIDELDRSFKVLIH